mmetsp:Transcript_29824/g.81841  ORF Transcript_29824/g.81841 Transcript_29824/m.81841 type:complete len:200 (-) Transcript_29824:417-1016(-)
MFTEAFLVISVWQRSRRWSRTACSKAVPPPMDGTGKSMSAPSCKRVSMTARFPRRTAWLSGVSPMPSTMFASAARSTSKPHNRVQFSRSLWVFNNPLCACRPTSGSSWSSTSTTRLSVERPARSVRTAEAPKRTSICAASKRWASTARINAVAPASSIVSTAAPISKSSWQTTQCPAAAARVSGALPRRLPTFGSARQS